MTNTIVTSVSVSKPFQELMEKYKLSPTEVFRRGIAVMCCDMGVKQYSTERNEERSRYVNEFMKEIKKEENMRKKELKIEEIKKIKKQISKEITNLSKSMQDLKQTMEEIHNGKEMEE